MPTKKPIISFPVDEELLKRIDDYRRVYEGRIPPRSDAIRHLLDEALSKYEKQVKKPKK
jgi:metal-responsive CopG/Arc/MetJ family transcriptional regulator